MNYASPLLEGQFLKRYKRFFADVMLHEKKIVAHVPNTGSLKGVCETPDPGETLRLCRVLPNDNPERKLKFTLEQVQTQNSWVGVNAHRANDLVWQAYQNKVIPHWSKYIDGHREAKINAKTRLDFKFVDKANKLHFVEVKSVTLLEESIAMFPDAETTRGQKHLIEMMQLIEEGATCEILYVVQRMDGNQFTPCDAIDPEYGRLLRGSQKKGLRISAYSVDISEKKIELSPKQQFKILL